MIATSLEKDSRKYRDVTPAEAGFHQPAEWEDHEAVWLAWPSHAELWREDLLAAQAEFLDFAKAIADLDPATKQPRGERMNVLVPDVASGAAAEKALAGLPVRIHLIPFGDIWLRDTAPVFLKDEAGLSATVRFHFNGWGGKFELPHDDLVSTRIAETTNLRAFSVPFVLEGGSVEVDGQGTCLVTRQCLLNENRNPGLTEEQVEIALKNTFGVEKVLWLDSGLKNDHTDGHIDNIARFIAPGVVLCMKSDMPDDPNRETYLKIEADLRAMTDARGRRLRVLTVTSPGRIENEEGRIVPASYLNFYIANSTVIVPTYGSPRDDEAVHAISKCFPGRRTVGLSAIAILTGGGAFHCISQQQPK